MKATRKGEVAMKQLWYLSAIALLAVVGLLWQGGPAVASNEIAKQENNMVCTSCHDKPGSKLLTDEGKYYELMGTLEGFTNVETVFGKCTSCHVRKPGSLKLTPNGRKFERLVGDMQGLREMLEADHPVPPVDAGDGGGDAH
jgi:cytochrome c553